MTENQQEQLKEEAAPPVEGETPNQSKEHGVSNTAGETTEGSGAGEHPDKPNQPTEESDVPQHEEELDLSQPGLLKETQGFFTLMKHGKRSICPFKPERTQQEIDAKTQKLLRTSIITPSCNSCCPMFRMAKDDDKNYAVSISCSPSQEAVMYKISEGNMKVATAKQPQGTGKKGMEIVSADGVVKE